MTNLSSYIEATKLHNTGIGTSSGDSFWDSVTNFAKDVPNFLEATTYSAGIGLYNTGVAAVNLLSEDKIEEIKTAQWIDEFDSDLGKYYRENQSSIDVAGFALGSFVPGGLGVKALNVGLRARAAASGTGFIGRNMAASTGLRVPLTESYILKAAPEIAKLNVTSTLRSVNMRKAIASGFGKNLMESVAFETFATAAQWRSNFISEMDASDLMMNFVTGAGLGAGIGGLIDWRKATKAVKSAVKGIDREGNIGRMIWEPMPNATLGEQAFLRLRNKESIEEFIATTNLAIKGGKLSDDMVAVKKAQIVRAESAVAKLDADLAGGIRKMFKDDDITSKTAFNLIKSMGTTQATRYMAGVEEMLRVAGTRAGKAPSKNLELPGMPVTQELGARNVTFTQTYGMGNTPLDKAGRNISEVPIDTVLADTVTKKAGETLDKAVDRFVKSFKHKTNQKFDVISSNISKDEVLARFAFADKSKLQGMQRLYSSDIPMLEAALEQFDKVGKVEILSNKGKVIKEVVSKDDLVSEIIAAKKDVIKRGAKRNMPYELIAQRANVSPGYISGAGVSDSEVIDMFARQHVAAEMGITPKELHNIPKYIGTKLSERGNAANELELSMDVIHEQLSQAAQEVLDKAVAKAASFGGQGDLLITVEGKEVLANWSESLPANSEVKRMIQEASRWGAGAKAFTFADGNYGSLESLVNDIGHKVHQANTRVTAHMKGEWQDIINSFRNSPASAANFGGVMEQLAGVPERYGISTLVQDTADGVMRLRPIKHIDAIEKGEVLSKLSANAKDVIEISDPLVAKAIRTHVDLNATRVASRNELYQAQNQLNPMDPRVVYPVKPDPRKHPYVAFVTSEKAGGVPVTTMIHANTRENLEAMMARVKDIGEGYKVVTRTKGEVEEYYKALGTYDYNRTLNELDLDAALASKGINSQAMPITSADQIADRYVGWHINQGQKLNRDLVSTKYMQEFKALENLGREYSNMKASSYPDITSMLVASKDNPYAQYIRTALNVSNLQDYPMLSSVNNWIDSHVSKVWNSGVQAFREMKGIDRQLLDQINEGLERSGYKFAYKDAADVILANHPADPRVLSNFVRSAQNVLSLLFLRTDILHALNNQIGSMIMTAPEVRNILKGINSGDAEAVGKLAELSRVKIPGGDHTMFSPTKLMVTAWKNVFDKDLMQRAIASGHVPKDIEQAFKVIDNLSLNGAESASKLMAKESEAIATAKKLIKGAEKWTGNSFFESAGRFVSWDIMRQITEPAIKAGIMTAKEADSYISTFVNRTQVSLNAAQRPVAFQGPIGMAMGLFQSYQFNLMQQMFRYVGDSSHKTAAIMMGLQGSFYGLNGLPGFSALNSHIVGTASGNYQHKDFESEIPRLLGKEAGDFLLYGIPGSVLGLALHSRGDLTPQHATVLPSKIQDLPVVSMYSRIYNNLINTGKNLVEGADVSSTILSAIEHNSFNRPLSGFAQVMRSVYDGSGQVYSTTSNGEFLASNDLWSLATLARLSGGKPLDEALVRDLKYRTNFYKQTDRARRSKASEAIRISASGGGDVSSDLLDSSFDVFLQTGGSATDFNRWYLNLVKEATTPMAERLSQSLKGDYAQRMQDLINN